jgi:AsmA protein
MAWHSRRLIFWLFGSVTALVLLALLAIAALFFFLDPNDYRQRIQAEAARALGRGVVFDGELHWQLGSRIFIESRGGAVTNADGFDSEPLARWRVLRFGLAARPLLSKQIHVDRIEIDGLALNLQQNVAGAGNWNLGVAVLPPDPGSTPFTVHIKSLAISDSRLRYRDAASHADWILTRLNLEVDVLPADITATAREFLGIDLSAQLAGGSLQAGGVPVALRVPRLLHDAAANSLVLAASNLRWGEAHIILATQAALGDAPQARGRVSITAPSVRLLLATVGVVAPPMRDPATLGKLGLATDYNFQGHALALNALEMTLDDTRVTGNLALPQLQPLALRFDLIADAINVDRYLEPTDVKSDPFTLPLAQLKALDAKGVLHLHSATIAGAKATDLRIDIE